jgi:membrane-associated protease RseP (regulator of RpoE activity)
MKARNVVIAVLLTAATLTAGAETRSRTIVIKDGKVVTNTSTTNGVIDLDGELLGGKRAFLGVSLLDLTPELREHLGAPKENGALVSAVEGGSPAEKAGMRVGDIVVSIDGKEVDASRDLRRGLREKKDGDTVRVEVLRGRARQTLVATLVEREPTRFMLPRDLELGLGERFEAPEWRGRIERLGDCAALQSRIKELETRLHDLEKKLQK